MKFFAAPLQGYTEASYRHFHAEVYGCRNGAADVYYTPFVRVERNEVRQRDLKDTCSPLNINHSVVPQIIVRDKDEFTILVDTLIRERHKTIDLNMGCPFPPQTGKGRGAALIANTCVLEKIVESMHQYASAGIEFSAKMRLGVNSSDEWQQSIDVMNRMPLTHLTVHPRVARQQYSGELDFKALDRLIECTAHKIVFNGDIKTTDDINRIAGRFPSITTIMTGRGLLARPSLIAEWRNGSIWDHKERLDHILALHTGIINHYETTLCGESQILSKLKPFWEYLEDEIGRKTWKAIRKAASLSRYTAAISSLY